MASAGQRPQRDNRSHHAKKHSRDRSLFNTAGDDTDDEFGEEFDEELEQQLEDEIERQRIGLDDDIEEFKPIPVKEPAAVQNNNINNNNRSDQILAGMSDDEKQLLNDELDSLIDDVNNKHSSVEITHDILEGQVQPTGEPSSNLPRNHENNNENDEEDIIGQLHDTAGNENNNKNRRNKSRRRVRIENRPFDNDQIHEIRSQFDR